MLSDTQTFRNTQKLSANPAEPQFEEAEQASGKCQTALLAPILSAFRHRHKMKDDAELAAWLGIDRLELYRLALCFKPGASGLYHYQADIEVISIVFGISPAKLTQIVEDAV